MVSANYPKSNLAIRRCGCADYGSFIRCSTSSHISSWLCSNGPRLASSLCKKPEPKARPRDRMRERFLRPTCWTNVSFVGNEIVLTIEDFGARLVEVFVDLKKGQVNIFERNDIDVHFAVNIHGRPWTIRQHPVTVVWVVFASGKDLIEYPPLGVFIEIDKSGRLRLNGGSISD